VQARQRVAWHIPVGVSSKHPEARPGAKQDVIPKSVSFAFDANESVGESPGRFLSRDLRWFGRRFRAVAAASFAVSR